MLFCSSAVGSEGVFSRMKVSDINFNGRYNRRNRQPMLKDVRRKAKVIDHSCRCYRVFFFIDSTLNFACFFRNSVCEETE